jgi:4,5-DOPA dioxygenase extradiol
MMPTMFVSHGSPMVLLQQDMPAHHFLAEAAALLPKPKAIVVVTAHWLTRNPAVGGVAKPEIIYDFGPFDPRLFTQQYPAPGAPDLAGWIADAIGAAGLPVSIDQRRGLDHGVWIPLKLMYPAADIPVVSLAVQPHFGPAHHLALGRALEGLRNEDILVLGSGSFTHDLHRYFSQSPDAAPPHDVAAFSEWMHQALIAGDTQSLLTYRTAAPFAVENHPTDEHLLPIFAALGAAGEGAKGTRVHQSSDHGVLRMDAYSFA